MSVAGIMMVRDEVDIIEASVRHLAANVDQVHVWDNLSTDGTGELLSELADELPLTVYLDEEVGYYQSRKMSEYAQRMRDGGFAWVVPCDADELWYGPEGKTVAEYLTVQGRDVQLVSADLYNYLPPCEGIGQVHPYRAITWRQSAAGALPKVACRTHAALKIAPGNHGASYGTMRTLTVPGLVIRHFSWRTPEQFLLKIRNGLEAYGAANVNRVFGTHWRMFDGATDEEIKDHFAEWFCIKGDPSDDPELTYDPAEVMGWD